MAERRSLVEGLQSPAAPTTLEQSFVYGADKARPESLPPLEPLASSKLDETAILPQISSRVPLHTRVRPEIASAIKRASLTRQLQGQEPYYVQDIIEHALETWLRTNGFVK